MVAIPSHLTDKTNSLKSNTTISRYIRVTFKTFNVWTQHLFVCCTVRDLDWQQILGGSGLLWGVQSMLDCVRLWGVLRSVWCLWPFVSFKQFQSSFSSVAGCIGPPPPPTNWLFLLEPASSCRSLIEVFLPTEGSSSPVTKRLLIGNGRIVFFSLLL